MADHDEHTSCLVFYENVSQNPLFLLFGVNGMDSLWVFLISSSILYITSSVKWAFDESRGKRYRQVSLLDLFCNVHHFGGWGAQAQGLFNKLTSKTGLLG